MCWSYQFPYFPFNLKTGESQRHDRFPYWFNEAETAVSEVMDSGVRIYLKGLNPLEDKTSTDKLFVKIA